MVVAPYLSPSVRERLVEAGLGFIDLTGNVRVALSRPGSVHRGERLPT